MTTGKKGWPFVAILIMVYLLSLVIAKTDTSAWFISESNANGNMVNATTEDLLLVESKVISYDTNCKVNIKIDIKNISGIEIPIQIKGFQEHLSPGQKFSKVLQEKVSCEATEASFNLTGLNYYIGESIQVPLNNQSLLETDSSKQKGVQTEVPEKEDSAVETDEKEADEIEREDQVKEEKEEEEKVDEVNNEELEDDVQDEQCLDSC